MWCTPSGWECGSVCMECCAHLVWLYHHQQHIPELHALSPAPKKKTPTIEAAPPPSWPLCPHLLSHTCVVLSVTEATPRASPALLTRMSTCGGGRGGEKHAQHSTAQHSTAQHSTAQHSTAQHSTHELTRSTHNKAQHICNTTSHIVSPGCPPGVCVCVWGGGDCTAHGSHRHHISTQ
jgi:hypothetical protein